VASEPRIPAGEAEEMRAEAILRRREVLGWRLGLERMRRLCSLLGMPQNRFASIHVVGTNGKTSVCRMIAALLEAHGVSAGAYASPHIHSWRERVLIRGEPIAEDAFADAVERAEQAAQVADRSAGDEGPVTQFELLSAAAFVAFAEAHVQYGVVEAGLGGRLDATNVIPSKLTVLTSVGLDHTEYLGDTLEEIAAEKLAVLRDHTTLIRGQVPPEVEPVIEREVERSHARVISSAAVVGVPREVPSALSGYQGVNLGLATAAVQGALGRFDGEAALRAIDGQALAIPGRAELVQGDPPMIFDAAHNPDGARALAELLPDLAPARELRARPFGLEHLLKPFRAIGPKRLQKRCHKRADQREVVCCLAVLDDKDVGGIVRALTPACAHFVCTEVAPEQIEGSGRPGGRSTAAGELADLCHEAGAGAEAIADPLKAWRRARDLARDRDGVALAAGSHYLLGSIWTERRAANS
jgi:dihydrofolate synthase / folylpolyglutamate synthase